MRPFNSVEIRVEINVAMSVLSLDYVLGNTVDYRPYTLKTCSGKIAKGNHRCIACSTITGCGTLSELLCLAS